MKALFYGTPEVAVPYLELMAKRCELLGVLTQPDRPSGRGLELKASSVKRRALELGLHVLSPNRPSEVACELSALGADVAVCVAYGRILKREVLAAPRLGTLNVHFSLLPKYRGAAPVPWSLVRGERESGVTVFWLDEGMDTGPIFLQRSVPVGDDEDAAGLLKRLEGVGLEVLDQALSELAAGKKRAEPQAGEPSLAPLIKPEDARVLTFARPAAEIHNLVRGFCLWPRVSISLSGPAGRRIRLILLKTQVEDSQAQDSAASPPGTILRVDRGGGVLLQCRPGRLSLLMVQPEGKKPVAAADFLNGLRLGAGAVLSLNND
jgi:methionyl-tRNA formyltransferase